MYCIMCEREIIWETHTIIVPPNNEPEFCDGDLLKLIVSCPPPILEEKDWEWIFEQEPGMDEIEYLNSPYNLLVAE